MSAASGSSRSTRNWSSVSRQRTLEFAFGAAYGLVRDDPRYLSQAYARVSLYF